MVLTGPLEPTRARLAKTFPVGPTWVYEPKWDGFRYLLFRNAPTSTCNRDRSRVPVATATVSGLVCEKDESRAYYSHRAFTTCAVSSLGKLKSSTSALTRSF